MVVHVVHPGRAEKGRADTHVTTLSGFAASIAWANAACSSSGSAAAAIAATAGRSVRSGGSVYSPASGPASAGTRCLTCSAVAAPSAKHMLIADSRAASRASPPAASGRSSPACPG